MIFISVLALLGRSSQPNIYADSFSVLVFLIFLLDSIGIGDHFFSLPIVAATLRKRMVTSL